MRIPFHHNIQSILFKNYLPVLNKGPYTITANIERKYSEVQHFSNKQTDNNMLTVSII